MASSSTSGIHVVDFDSTSAVFYLDTVIVA